MTVVLRQAGRLESLGGIEVHPPLDCFPIPKSPHVSHRLVDGGTAESPHCRISAQDDNAILTGRDELSGDRSEVIEGRAYLTKRAADAFVPAIGAPSSGDLIRLIPDDFGIEKVEVRNSVAIEVLVEASDELHVLLRHRPRSISQRQESA